MKTHRQRYVINFSKVKFVLLTNAPTLGLFVIYWKGRLIYFTIQQSDNELNQKPSDSIFIIDILSSLFPLG